MIHVSADGPFHLTVDIPAAVQKQQAPVMLAPTVLPPASVPAPAPAVQNPKKYECRFVTYCRPNSPGGKDLHVIKELIHHPDGTIEPHLRLKYDYERPFWVTRKDKRNHKQKKEWELEENLQPYKSRQCDLIRTMAKAIEEPWFKGNQRQLQRSPYIYGSDISSTAIIKHSYMNQFPDLFTPFRTAVFDIETNVLDGSEDIMMATLSFENKVFTAVREDFVSGIGNPEERLRQMSQLYLGKYMEKRGIEWEVIFVPRSSDVIVETFKRAHKWMPDFVAIWNIDFDLPRAVKALEKDGIDPAQVFSDPKIPRDFRFFEYKQGSKQKVTASGKITPRKPSDQWHTAYCPASFYFIDAMCAYRQVRVGKAEEQSYGLDPILEKNLGIRKLNFTMADGLVKLEWHKFMQARHPLEYIIYNKFDCISVEELNDKTTDLSIALPLNAEHSDFSNYNSQPRRLVDKLHFFVKERGYVFASTSDQMEVPEDKMTIGLEGHIITLAAHLVADNGLRIIKDMPWMVTNIRVHVGDLDVSAAYPTNEGVFNISKQTTFRELIEIVGVSERTLRAQGINLSGGQTNAVEFCTEMFGMPTQAEMLTAFLEDELKLEDNPYLEIQDTLVLNQEIAIVEAKTPYVELHDA